MLPPARPLSPCLALLIAACANLPPKSYPPFVEQDLEASFLVGASGRIDFPVTTDDLIVERLELSPTPLDERFDGDGRRWFVFAPDTEVRLHARLRSYAGGPSQKSLDAALRAAHHVSHDPRRDH